MNGFNQPVVEPYDLYQQRSRSELQQGSTGVGENLIPLLKGCYRGIRAVGRFANQAAQKLSSMSQPQEQIDQQVKLRSRVPAYSDELNLTPADLNKSYLNERSLYDVNWNDKNLNDNDWNENWHDEVYNDDGNWDDYGRKNGRSFKKGVFNDSCITSLTKALEHMELNTQNNWENQSDSDDEGSYCESDASYQTNADTEMQEINQGDTWDGIFEGIQSRFRKLNGHLDHFSDDEAWPRNSRGKKPRTWPIPIEEPPASPDFPGSPPLQMTVIGESPLQEGSGSGSDSDSDSEWEFTLFGPLPEEKAAKKELEKDKSESTKRIRCLLIRKIGRDIKKKYEEEHEKAKKSGRLSPRLEFHETIQKYYKYTNTEFHQTVLEKIERDKKRPVTTCSTRRNSGGCWTTSTFAASYRARENRRMLALEEFQKILLNHPSEHPGLKKVTNRESSIRNSPAMQIIHDNGWNCPKPGKLEKKYEIDRTAGIIMRKAWNEARRGYDVDRL